MSVKLLNGKDTVCHISDFKGKLLIIDFWATWCAPCRTFLKTSDSLNREFEGRAVILPVTSEDSSAVMPFLRSYKKFTGIEIMTGYKDVTLNIAFNHKIIPHEVWIDPRGKVVAITDCYNVTSDNISKVLSGSIPAFTMKDDRTLSDIDLNKPVLLGDKKIPIPDSLVLLHKTFPGYEVIITKYCKKFQSAAGIGTDEDLFHAFNVPVSELFLWAASKFELLNDNSIILKTKDSSRFIIPNDPIESDYWTKDNGYCFELLITDSSLRKERFSLAVKELNSYFGKYMHVEGKLTMEVKDAYVLKRTVKSDLILSKGGEPKERDNAYSLDYRNAAFSDFFFRMKTYYLQLLKYPLLDETNLGSQKVDIQLQCKLSDLPSINQAIKKYGLLIEKGRRRVECVLVKDK